MKSTPAAHTIPPLRNGARAVTHGMSSRLYNGVLGRLGKYDAESDRWVFRPDQDEDNPIRVRSRNLRWVASPNGASAPRENVFCLYAEYDSEYTNYPLIEFDDVLSSLCADFGVTFVDRTADLEQLVFNTEAVHPLEDYFSALRDINAESHHKPSHALLVRRTPASNPVFLAKRHIEDGATFPTFTAHDTGSHPLADYMVFVRGMAAMNFQGNKLTEAMVRKRIRRFLGDLIPESERPPPVCQLCDEPVGEGRTLAVTHCGHSFHELCFHAYSCEVLMKRIQVAATSAVVPPKPPSSSCVACPVCKAEVQVTPYSLADMTHLRGSATSDATGSTGTSSETVLSIE